MHRADVQALALGLLPDSAGALAAGAAALRRREEAVRALLASRSLPAAGWPDDWTVAFMQSLAAMDGNNAETGVGAGEREGRIFSRLVSARHWGLAHGVGRSGELTAAQPKAAGSSLLFRLTNVLALAAVRACGVTRAAAALVVPCATGLTLALTLRALEARAAAAAAAGEARPAGPRYVLWSRIDQKSCFKALTLAGLTPVVIELSRGGADGEELRTDEAALRAALGRLPAGSVAAVVTTTSCFAPRAPDDVVAVARLCAEAGVPHVVNHAYGLQLGGACHALDEACRVGRIDAFVSSTDKNFLVPVGGAIVASPDAAVVAAVARVYPGRASVAPIADLLVTFLAMGAEGLRGLLAQRKAVATDLRVRLAALAATYGERVIDCRANQISFAMTLGKLAGGGETAAAAAAATADAPPRAATYLGSMLFARGVSGARVVHPAATATIDGHVFAGYGAHCDDYPVPYLTVAAAIGMTAADVDTLMLRLERTIDEFVKQRGRGLRGEGAAAGEREERAQGAAALPDTLVD